MRRQRLPLSALDPESSGSFLFHQQSLVSAASGKPPVQVIFPDSTTSIAVPVSSVRDGFLSVASRRSTSEEENDTTTTLETSDDIILVLSDSIESRALLRTRIFLTISIILLQAGVIIAIYSGETPADWIFTKTSRGECFIYEWLGLAHLLFLLALFSLSGDLLTIYSTALASISIYGLMTSVFTALDLVALLLSLPIFLLTSGIRELLGPQCMYSLSRPENL